MKIAFIGGGNMGEAIVKAMLGKSLCKPGDISVSDISQPRREYLKDKYGISVTAENVEAIIGKDVVVLAVKPQDLKEVTSGLKGELKPGQFILSIIAGVRIKTIHQLTMHKKIVRAMPNTPAQVGLGISGWTASSDVTEEQREWAKTILGAMGEEIYFDDEEFLDIVTAISGSGPAYFYLFAECLMNAAVDSGLSQENAEKLIAQTMLGAAHLMDRSENTPAELRRNVTSKGGTTERAIEVFEKNKIAEIVGKAVNAAYRRAKELGEVKF